jgi:hypothetical protein
MNNIILLLGGRGIRMAEMASPKPFLKSNNRFLFEIAKESAQNFLPNSRSISILSPENARFVSENEIDLGTDQIFCLSEYTKGPAETARKVQVENSDPVYFLDCDLFFRIDRTASRNDFDCELFYQFSSNPSHSFITMSGDEVAQIEEKSQISNNGIVGFYGFKNKKYFDELYDRTVFTGERFMSTVVKTALLNEDRVLARRCSVHLPLGTKEEYKKNISLAENYK